MKARCILENNPTITAYRMSFLTQRYITKLSRLLEDEHDLLFHEWALVFILFLKPDLTATDLVEVTGRPKNTISRALSKLISMKLVKSSKDASDSRSKVLRLTAQGRSLYESFTPVVEGIEREMYSVLSAQESAALNACLARVIDSEIVKAGF
ncbi:MarR family transcriptional regulator [Burkholderia sp. WAC0059]|uniref:MarR family winged helix-turn-helix transcriptional regulator n=1 Tax=Burkholderia sp. WAC0059 TaxID=2066022 RepID=UPI000C7F7762|nr:MarR family winged helix-turn-helix transcriptional regulator [Burkholderia sp. WAC0059]PLZ02140.1 MarR family transcriptional regulator [Burkholderia sp. WAC0059]